MDLWLDDESETPSDPMDTVETVIGSDDRFQSERAEDADVHFSFKTSWGESVGYFSYRHELPALLFTLGFEIQAPVSRRTETLKLASLINENLWLGHFDVWSNGSVLLYRHGLMLGDEGLLSPSQAQMAVEAAIIECDRFYPVFQFILWGDKTPAEALAAAMVDAAGEA